MHLDRLACALGIAFLLSGQVPVWAQRATADSAPDTRTLPATIPIFPLPDAVLFPKVSLPLHIFEPRYRAMVADALKGDRIIGMVLLRPGYEADYEGRPPIHPIGCAGVIADVQELPDGRFNIVLDGLVKFRVTDEDRTRSYRLARVSVLPESPNDEERAALRKERQRLESLLPGADRPPREIPDDVVVNTLAQYMDIEPIERQELLELDGPLARSKALIELLETR
jgi:hypothetical protein